MQTPTENNALLMQGLCDVPMPTISYKKPMTNFGNMLSEKTRCSQLSPYLRGCKLDSLEFQSDSKYKELSKSFIGFSISSQFLAQDTEK